MEMRVTKIESTPPRWRLSWKGRVAELSTNELLNQSRFRRRVMEHCADLPPRLPQRKFEAVLRELLATMQIIQPQGDRPCQNS
jgi:hypothetical protein